METPASNVDLLFQNLTMVLGPTNTGKTHLALERMTGYASGMIGFPSAFIGARKL